MYAGSIVVSVVVTSAKKKWLKRKEVAGRSRDQSRLTDSTVDRQMRRLRFLCADIRNVF